MPLINSLDETRLKGLRYSGFQPLITKDVNDPPVYQSFMQEINSRGDDVVRLSKLLFTGQGLKFATNTAGLQAISPTTATKQLQDRPVPPNQMGGNNTTGFGDFLRVLGGVVTTIARSVVETAAIVPSTIAQAGTAGTGQRFVRGFAGGSGYLPGVRGHVRSKNGTAIEAPGNNEFSKLYNAETQLLKKDAALTEGEILDGARPSISAENIVLNQHRNKGRELYDFSDQNESDLIGNQNVIDFENLILSEYKSLVEADPLLNSMFVFSNSNFSWSQKEKSWYNTSVLNLSNIGLDDINASIDGFIEIKYSDEYKYNFKLFLQPTPELWFFMHYDGNKLNVSSSDFNLNKDLSEITTSSKDKYIPLSTVDEEYILTFINNFRLTYFDITEPYDLKSPSDTFLEDEVFETISDDDDDGF